MPDVDHTATLPLTANFLLGGGEMGVLTHDKDWSSSLIGIPANWPQSLRTALGILLNSKFPMFLFWGPQLIGFYNDAYKSILGENGKHPEILGMPAKQAWSEIWHIIEPLLEQVIATGVSVWREDQLVPIFRNGQLENVYWTFSYSGVYDEAGKIGGVLVVCSDTTEKITGLKNTALIARDDNETSQHEISRQRNFVNTFNESEKKFRNTVMQAPVGISVLRGTNYIVEMANDASLGLINKNENAFVGRPLFESLPEIQPIVAPLLANVLKTGIAFNTTELAIPLNRFGKLELRYFNIIFQALKEDDNSISGIIVIASEVSAIVKARHALAEDEKHFRKRVMQSPVPMAIFRGADFIIESGNHEMFKNIWRKEAIDVLGKKALDVFPELKGQKYPELLQKVYNTAEIVRETESIAYVQGDDGLKKFYLDYEYSPLFDIHGKVSGIMVTVNDVTEKVEARQQLEVSEARLRLATEGTSLATWDLDIHTGELIHSPRLAEIFGYAPGTALTHAQARSTIHKDDLALVEKAFEEALATSVYAYEARIVHANHTVHWIKTQGKVLYNENHAPVRLIGTLIDNTENKINEVEIARLAAIVQSSQDAIISKSLTGIIITWNDAAEKMLGYTAQEMIGQHVSKLIPEDRQNEEVVILAQIQKGEPVNSFQTKRITKNRTILDISLTISPIRNNDGKIIGASKIARDISRQKLIENQITASEEKFRLLANSMAQLVWTGDADGTLNYFNQAVYNYSGFSVSEIEKGGWLQIVHPDDREENIQRWKHAISTGEDFIFEHRFRMHNGEYRWQLSRALPQKDSSGKIQMWVGTSTDIHEIKENEQQKDFFISMASHELKTPITSIKGYVQILMSMYNDKEDVFLKNSLKTVNKQINTLITLIADLLDLSKIKSGSLQLKKERFYINDLVHETIKEVQHTQPDCVINFTGKANAPVYADRGRIGQVLINFLTNAIKYSPDCREIHVASKIGATEISVAVTDSGIGISKADQEKIFQRFYRVAGKDEQTFPGFGIGLFIAAEIIQRHDGKIGVESEPGKGSVFYFSIPLIKNN